MSRQGASFKEPHESSISAVKPPERAPTELERTHLCMPRKCVLLVLLAK